MPAPRPPQPPTPAPDAFEIHRARVADDMQIAFIREGVGGYPLLLVHGYPETKRIWWRNIEPLARAGYEVIVPDLRGYGDSDLSEKDEYDLALYSRDLYALVHDVLGHERCGLLGGDVGGVVICDMANRFPGFVDRMILFNTVAPMVPEREDWYAEGVCDPAEAAVLPALRALGVELVPIEVPEHFYEGVLLEIQVETAAAFEELTRSGRLAELSDQGPEAWPTVFRGGWLVPAPEYVQVLRLMETFRPNEVEGGVRDALRLGAIGFDAVKHLVLCRIEHRPPRLDLDVYPYLPRARVATTSARAYMSLLAGP